MTTMRAQRAKEFAMTTEWPKGKEGMNQGGQTSIWRNIEEKNDALNGVLLQDTRVERRKETHPDLMWRPIGNAGTE